MFGLIASYKIFIITLLVCFYVRSEEDVDPKTQLSTIHGKKSSLPSNVLVKPNTGLRSVGARRKYKHGSGASNELRNNFKGKGAYVRPNITEFLKNFPVNKRLYFLF